jgi:hypothetical protein
VSIASDADWIPAFAGMTTLWIGAPVGRVRSQWEDLVAPTFLAAHLKLNRTAVGQARDDSEREYRHVTSTVARSGPSG